MNLSVRTVVSVGLMVFSAFDLSAVTADNPYHTILDRNPFGLNPPALVSTNSLVEPPRNVKFNGISNIGGVKKAFFTISGKEPKDPPKYVTLAESEHADVLEVSKILAKEGEVEVVNSGVKMVLNFKNNGNKPAGTAPSIVSPVSPPVAGNPSGVVYIPPSNNSKGFEEGARPTSINSAQPVASAGVAPSVVYNPVLSGSTRGQLHSGGGNGNQSLNVGDQQALMQLNHQALSQRFEAGQRDTVNYSTSGPDNPVVHSPRPSSGPRRMVVDPPPPLPGT